MMSKKQTKVQSMLSYQFSSDTATIALPNQLMRAQANSITIELQQLLQEIVNTHKNLSHIQLDAGSVEHCDSAGLIILKQFLTTCSHKNISSTLTGLAKKFAGFWQAITQTELEKNTIESNQQQAQINTEKNNTIYSKQIRQVGKNIHQCYQQAKENITAVGEILSYLGRWVYSPMKFALRQFWYYIHDIGPGSLPLVALIGILFGLILSFQSIIQLKQFGAEIYTANLVSVSLIQELGPLLMAIVLIGRIASAYAAEISAMKVNQEIDALVAMGIDPVPFLVLPRLLAAAIVAPLLALLIDLFGLLGCGLLMLSEGFARDVIIQQMFSFVAIPDIFSSLFKSMVFGIVITSIGCIQGLNCGRDANAVGKATTTTVVRCIVTIVLVDGIFSVLFYALG